MLFTLWGDYVVHRGGEISVGSLIRIFAEFGLSELALRSVLARMRRAGWLETRHVGRRSFYHLSRRGQSVIREGTERIFRRGARPWDGCWHLVTYSVPETQRELRDQFRKRLAYLGFGSLAAGTWVTPHDLREDVSRLAEDLGVSSHVDQFRGAYLSPGEAPDLAERVWPLDRLARAYRDFSDRLDGIARELDAGVSDSRAFVLRFWLIHEYQRFFLEDPDLPRALVPSSWPARSIHETFDALHDRLAPAANRFFDVACRERPS